MADLSITATQVQPDTTSGVNNGYYAGATIAAGDVVYVDTSTSTWKLADTNDGGQSTATILGIALCGAVSGQPVTVQVTGSPTLGAGAAPVVGTIYVLSATPGKIAPAADLATGWRTSIIGVGTTGNKIKLNIFLSGASVP
jgi:hypothetical protein